MTSQEYTAGEREFLLALARAAIEEAANTGRMLHPDPAQETPPRLLPRRGCFVTLTLRGRLRGCIGHIQPQEPLWQAVISNAFSAAMRDPRFAPLTQEELEGIHIEISVLTEPKPLSYESPEELLRVLSPGRDGVVLRLARGGSATFLPQVWEQLPQPEAFLEHLSMKAGGGRDSWRERGTAVSLYTVEAFGE